MKSKEIEMLPISSIHDELKLRLILSDPRAIEIVENIPSKQRNEVIEKYIILGDMVISHASIATRKETVEEFFSPLKSDIELIREQLRQIVPTISIPAKKGEITEETIFKSLQEHFMDDSFEDVSRLGKYTDILASPADSPKNVLIELKDYKNIVPSKETDKFWRDMDVRGIQYGIFISMRSKIAKRSSCINLETRMNKTAIFVVNSELNWEGHLFAYYIIKKLIALELMKRKELKGEELSKIITRINKHVIELKTYSETINKIVNIADNLRTTCKKRLDELINLSNINKGKIDLKITEILEEIEKGEIS